MTANSFAALSLHPPLVLFCAGKESRAGQMLHVGMPFSINILTQSQRDLSTYFAGSWRGHAPPAFTFEPWHGAPRLAGSAAVIVCSVDAVHEGGDQWIVVGKVDDVDRGGPDGTLLVFCRGRYTVLDSGPYTHASLPPSPGH
jgi:3-hydroxy-9,10-secoandrosta-1,3,5(10)-triene-9,17-dione monooxygenase reductase component